MPVKIVSVDIARTMFTGLRTSPITQTPEFEEVRIKLGDGLRRNEAIICELAIDPKNKHKRASFKRAAVKLIRRLKLGYSVRGLRSGDQDVIIISNEAEQPVSPSLMRKAR